jgi:hypothetical protein
MHVSSLPQVFVIKPRTYTRRLTVSQARTKNSVATASTSPLRSSMENVVIKSRVSSDESDVRDCLPCQLLRQHGDMERDCYKTAAGTDVQSDCRIDGNDSNMIEVLTLGGWPQGLTRLQTTAPEHDRPRVHGGWTALHQAGRRR